MTAPTKEKDQRGWANWCPRCHRRYWVSASDLGRSKARRWADENCEELHLCPDMGPEPAETLEEKVREEVLAEVGQ